MINNIKFFNVIVAKLEGDKYFVGGTVQKNFKIDQLRTLYKGKSDWLVLNQPIKIIEIIDNCTEQDIDKYTLKYMKLYGMQNVRGHSYPLNYMDKETQNYLQRMIETKKL